MEEENKQTMSFWEHLDVLRVYLIRMAVALVVASVAAFCMKEPLFDLILGPQRTDFITYRWLEAVGGWFSSGASLFQVSDIQLINTGLASQFLIHMQASVYMGILVVSPYLLYQLFHFIAPALYANERRCVVRSVVSGFVLFFLGVLLSYYLIFPLTFRFLGSYQVSEAVVNMISLQSYMDTLMLMSLFMGCVFELPVLCWLLSRMGILTASQMRHYRRHAIVVLLALAAIITPTSDIFTLLLVSLPMCLLYEAGIWVAARAGREA